MDLATLAVPSSSGYMSGGGILFHAFRSAVARACSLEASDGLLNGLLRILDPQFAGHELGKECVA